MTDQSRQQPSLNGNDTLEVRLALRHRTAQLRAMIQGPDVVLACPHCQTLARLFTVASPDGTGALSWTDGYQEMPMTPTQPNISRCRECKKLMWVARCGHVATIEEGKVEHDEFRELPYLEPVDEADYIEAVDTGMAELPEQETELRVFAWWRGNDRYRRLEGPGRYPTSPESVANLERLIGLLRDGEHEFVLFRAEALRELGRFEEAGDALHGICSDYALARERIASLLEEKSRNVELLFSSDTIS